MSKTLTEIRALARSHTVAALMVLVDIMRDADATPAARAAAANAVLDRGWGKPTPPPGEDDAGAPAQINKIERVIVDPENSDS